MIATENIPVKLPLDRRELTPDVLVAAYRAGRFPVGNRGPGGGEIHWPRADPRAVIPLDELRISTRILRRIPRFEVTVDTAFEEVIRSCAARETTWLTEEIVQASLGLHTRGVAHSVESWQGGRLAGGVYGVALGGAFFAESMFHRVSDGSKVALAQLVHTLRAGGFVLLDMQIQNPLIARFGAAEIPHALYEARLRQALEVDARF